MNVYHPFDSFAVLQDDSSATASKPIMNDQIQVRVTRVANETGRIRTYELVRPDGSSLPPFAAGSHVSIRLPSGLVRHYSIANNPSETHRYVLGIQRDANSQGGSSYIHDTVREGDMLFIGAPVNNFALHDAAARTILIAGGIGITPIMSMAHQLNDRGAAFALYYLTRSAVDTAFKNDIGKFAQRTRFHHDEGMPDKQFDLTSLLREVSPDTHIYCCGPAGLMAAVSAASAHWPPEQVHFEYFSTATPLETQADQPFEVVLARSNLTLPVQPGETILQVLLRHNVDVPYSCEEGTCGSCVIKVMDGIPDHRDVVLDAAERASNKVITVCCSRAISASLVLDL